ncbi:signal recognition particle receptor, beta subunit, partial [Kipferlia bialata]|eukprot:g13502.t1
MFRIASHVRALMAVPPLTVSIAGGQGCGKTSLYRYLLTAAQAKSPSQFSRLRPSTGVDVSAPFKLGPHSVILQDLPGSEDMRSTWASFIPQ